MLDEARLERLLGAYFDQSFAPGEKAELELMLLSSSRAREIFRHHADLHGLAREWALRSHSDDLMRLAGDGSVPVLPREKPAFRGWIAAAIAACVLLAVGLFLRGKGPADLTPSSDEFAKSPPLSARSANLGNIALLNQTAAVEWEKGSLQPETGAALAPGWLQLKRGTIGLEFYSGARVVVEGPAKIELVSENEARLEKGRLTARVAAPARGFTVHHGTLQIVDHGTEFAVNALDANNLEVHVFEGEVSLQDTHNQTDPKPLIQGQALSIRHGIWTAVPASRAEFIDPASFQLEEQRELEGRWNAWRAGAEKFRETPDLKVYFDFQNLGSDRHLVQNLAKTSGAGSSGSLIGCETTQGRMPGKQALGFAKTSDRVRFQVPGGAPAFTVMAWVRVDSLPLDHNALLSMSPNTVGEIHWKIDRGGRLLMGLRAENRYAFDAWDRLESPPVIGEEDFGRWVHLATVVNGAQGYMLHVVNGREVARGPIRHMRVIPFGVADLGNFSAESYPPSPEGNPIVVRNFTGRIDEFALIARALTVREIAAMR